MQVGALAKALRRRQLKAGLAAKALINSRDDMQIIAAYLLCCKCGGDLFDDRQAAVENSKTVQEFLMLTEMAIAAHHCKNRN